VKVEKVKLKRYSVAFKKEVVREYEGGTSETSLKQKYGIGGSTTISRWIKKYGRYGMRHELMVIQKPEEQNQIKELQKRIQELETAVAQTVVDKLMLESLVAQIEAEMGVDLKKNIGRQSLSAPRPKPKNRRSQ